MWFVEKMKGFLLSPAATFRAVRGEALGDALVYFLVLLVFGALMAAASTSLFVFFMKHFSPPVMEQQSAGVSTAILGGFVFMGMFISSLIVGILLIFITGLWLHLWVYVFGGRHGVSQTLKACMYAATPSLLFGWIPFIGIVFAFWAFILQIIGVRELHEISTGMAVAAVLVSLVVAAVLAVALILTLLPLPPTCPTCGV